MTESRAGGTQQAGEDLLRFQASILESVQDSIIVTDLSGVIMHWNKGATALFGYSAEEMLGQTVERLYPEQQPQALARDLARILEGQDYAGEWQGRRKDGTLLWVDVKTSLMRNARGEPTGFIGVSKDITARRKAEEALRESELKYRLATLASNDALRDWDLITGTLLWNLNVQTLFGYSAQELTPVATWWFERIHPEDRERVDRGLQEIIDGNGLKWEGEYRFLRRDGTFAHVMDRAYVARDATSKAVRMVGAMRDITQRKRSEQQLRLLSEASRLLVERTDDPEDLLQRVARLVADSFTDMCAVALLQEDGTPRPVAAAHRDVRKEPLLWQALRFVPRQDSPDPLLRALRSGQTCLLADFVPLRAEVAESAEHLQLLEALDVRSVMVVPLRSPGRLVGLMTLNACEPGQRFDAEDLALGEELARRVAGALERHRLLRETQEALSRAEQEKRRAEMLSRLGLAFASELDRDKLLQRITDEATALTGAAFGAFFHKLVNDQGEAYLLYTLSGAPREALEGFPLPRNTPLFRPTFEGTRTVRLDDVTQSPDYGQNPPHHGMPEGHLPVKSYLAVPVRSRSGTVLGGLLFGHPEPGRFRHEHEQLVECLAAQAAVALDNSLLYRQAQLAISLRDEFLQVAAHELHTPTTSLKLHVQSLLRAASEHGPALSVEKLRSRLEGVERTVGKLSVLINELLDISRITSGGLQLTREEVDLASVAQEVASRFEAQAAHARSALHLSVRGPLMGRWDRLRLEQVVTNLLSNAIKYGAGAPVHLETSASDTHARLVVRDEGIGIAPEALSRIFGRFERAVSERHYGGLGLGLYITRQIVQAHGGTIHVESHPGQGATFTVELPLRPVVGGT
ncbi:MAG: PAS domain S-box protein [Myxococcaceae bacterium]|nr:PAS domain S-box protein [Myxococcaceae bacterium]